MKKRAERLKWYESQDYYTGSKKQEKKLPVMKKGKTLIERKVRKRWGEQKCRERVG